MAVKLFVLRYVCELCFTWNIVPSDVLRSWTLKVYFLFDYAPVPRLPLCFREVCNGYYSQSSYSGLLQKGQRKGTPFTQGTSMPHHIQRVVTVNLISLNLLRFMLAPFLTIFSILLAYRTFNRTNCEITVNGSFLLLYTKSRYALTQCCFLYLG